jgi:hypothetical protein
MPQYQITSPSGQKYRVTAPEGATQEEVLARVQAQESAAPAAPTVSKTDARSMLKAGMKGAAPVAVVANKRDEISRIAKERIAERDRINPLKNVPVLGEMTRIGDSAMASVSNTFGIGPRLRAGMDALTTDQTYDDALAIRREESRLLRDRSLTGEIAGAVMGGAGVTGAVNTTVKGITGIAPKVGKALESLTTLTKGQKVFNATKIVGTGAAAGAAQAAGEGTDVGQGALYGGVGAGLIGGGVNLVGAGARKLWRPFSADVDKALREVVEGSADDIAARQADLSRRTGENVPVIAALSDGDFGRVTERVLKQYEPANEIAKARTGEKINGFMKRMEGHVKRAGVTAERFIDRKLLDKNMQPAVLDVDGRPLSLPASGTIADLNDFRKDIADQMMEPIRNNTLDLTQLKLPDIQKRLTVQIGRQITEMEPDIKAAFTNLSVNPVNVTVKQLDSLRQALDGASERGSNTPVQVAAYKNASKAIRDFVERSYPDYGKMIDVYAANSRMLEGFRTAASGKRISDIDDVSLARNVKSREGRVGMMLGELHRQREAVGKSPSSAISAAKNYGAEGKLTRQADPMDPVALQPGTVTENLSATSAADLADASRAEYEVLQRMTKAGGIDVSTAKAASLDSPGTLAYGAAIASGPTFMATKVNFLNKLMRGFPTQMSPKVAENLTEMLFSSDRAQSSQAIRALQRLGMTEQAMRSMMLPVAVGAGAARSGGEAPMEQPVAPVVEEPVSEPEAQLQQIYTEQPQIADLASRVEQVESNGDQNAVSPKGAVGVMQVMPTTAPEAAALAGVPFDEELYRTDEAYNRLLGTAYLAEMLRQFEGNEAYAVAAYNAGPARVRRAITNGENWLAVLPAETQDYVQKVLG